jgi:hypothetical protein
MWHETPEQQLLYIRQQQAAGLRMAATDRSGPERRGKTRHGAGFTGLRIRLGTLLIVVGRTLCDEEALRHDAAHS